MKKLLDSLVIVTIIGCCFITWMYTRAYDNRQLAKTILLENSQYRLNLHCSAIGDELGLESYYHYPYGEDMPPEGTCQLQRIGSPDYESNTYTFVQIEAIHDFLLSGLIKNCK